VEAYFTQELIIALVIAAIFWLGWFFIDAISGGGSLGVWLIAGAIVVIILLIVGFISPFASFILSVGIHSFLTVFGFFQIYKSLKEKNSSSD
jgi:hypothetical protein